MKRECNVCGRSYEAQRSTSKFCSPKCRLRNHHNSSLYQSVSPETSNNMINKDINSINSIEVSDESLFEVTKAELESAGVANTVIGKQALRLARSMEFETTGMSSLSKEFSRVMSAALRVGESLVNDSVDEFTAKREAKMTG